MKMSGKYRAAVQSLYYMSGNYATVHQLCLTAQTKILLCACTRT